MPDLEFDIIQGDPRDCDINVVYFLEEEKWKKIAYLIKDVLKIKTVGELYDQQGLVLLHIENLGLLSNEDREAYFQELGNAFNEVGVH